MRVRMKPGSKTLRRSVACLATGLTVYGAAAAAQIPAGSLYVDVSGAAVTVHADSVSVSCRAGFEQRLSSLSALRADRR